jgi:hypothetical protein
LLSSCIMSFSTRSGGIYRSPPASLWRRLLTNFHQFLLPFVSVFIFSEILSKYNCFAFNISLLHLLRIFRIFSHCPIVLVFFVFWWIRFLRRMYFFIFVVIQGGLSFFTVMYLFGIVLFAASNYRDIDQWSWTNYCYRKRSGRYIEDTWYI